MSWREYANKGQWRKVSPSGMSLDELKECFQTLSAVVPIKTKGDGVETYRDYIDAKDAEDWETYAAAQLLHEIRRTAANREQREPISPFLRDAILVAKAVLAENGIVYEGMHQTYLFWDKPDKFRQLEGAVGAALLERKDKWERELIYAPEFKDDEALKIALLEYNRRLDLYPWRRVWTLHTGWKIGNFPENSKLEHAISLLESSRYFSDAFSSVHSPDYSFGTIGNRGHRAVSAMFLAESAFIIGREYEAIGKKQFELHALRGMKTASAAREGGNARSVARSQLTDAVLTTMASIMSDGHTIRRAAELAFRRGFGTSEEANRKLWTRHKNKLGT